MIVTPPNSAEGSQPVTQTLAQDLYPTLNKIEFSPRVAKAMRGAGMNPTALQQRFDKAHATGDFATKAQLANQFAAISDQVLGGSATTNWLDSHRPASAEEVEPTYGSVSTKQAFFGSIKNGFVDMGEAVPQLLTAGAGLTGIIDKNQWARANKAISETFSGLKTYVSQDYQKPLVSYDDTDGVTFDLNFKSFVGTTGNLMSYILPGLLTAGAGSLATMGTRAALRGATTATERALLTGQLVKAGKIATNVTGLSSFLQTFPMYQREAMAAGLDVQDATLYAIPVAGLNAVIETANMGALTKALGISEKAAQAAIRQASLNEAVDALAKLPKGFTAEMLLDTAEGASKNALGIISRPEELSAFGKIVSTIGGRVKKGFLEQGIPEGGEEFFQSLVENGSKSIYNNLADGDSSGRFKDPSFGQYAFDAIYGSLLGAIVGTVPGTFFQSREADPTVFGYVGANVRNELRKGTAIADMLSDDAQNPARLKMLGVLDDKLNREQITPEEHADLTGKVKRMAQIANDFASVDGFTEIDRKTMFDVSEAKYQSSLTDAQVADAKAQLALLDQTAQDASLSMGERMKAEIAKGQITRTLGGLETLPDGTQVFQAEARQNARNQLIDATVSQAMAKYASDEERPIINKFVSDNLQAIDRQFGQTSFPDDFKPTKFLTDPQTGTTYVTNDSKLVFRALVRQGGQVTTPPAVGENGEYIPAVRNEREESYDAPVDNLDVHIGLATAVQDKNSPLEVVDYRKPDNSAEGNLLADGAWLADKLETLEITKEKAETKRTKAVAAAWLNATAALANDPKYADSYAAVAGRLIPLAGIKQKASTSEADAAPIGEDVDLMAEGANDADQNISPDSIGSFLKENNIVIMKDNGNAPSTTLSGNDRWLVVKLIDKFIEQVAANGGTMQDVRDKFRSRGYMIGYVNTQPALNEFIEKRLQQLRNKNTSTVKSLVGKSVTYQGQTGTLTYDSTDGYIFSPDNSNREIILGKDERDVRPLIEPAQPSIPTPEPTAAKPYNVQVLDEQSAIVNGEPYKIQVNSIGNTVSLTNGRRTIRHLPTLIEVDIQRNKLLSDGDVQQELDKTAQAIESQTGEGVDAQAAIDNAFMSNMTDRVASLMDNGIMTDTSEGDFLQASLFVQNAFDILTKNFPDSAYAQSLAESLLEFNTYLDELYAQFKTEQNAPASQKANTGKTQTGNQNKIGNGPTTQLSDTPDLGSVTEQPSAEQLDYAGELQRATEQEQRAAAGEQLSQAASNLASVAGTPVEDAGGASGQQLLDAIESANNALEAELGQNGPTVEQRPADEGTADAGRSGAKKPTLAEILPTLTPEQQQAVRDLAAQYLEIENGNTVSETQRRILDNPPRIKDLQQSFTDIMGKAYWQKVMEASYGAKRGDSAAMTLDQYAQSISGKGITITEQDVAEFINENPFGTQDFKTAQRRPIREAFRQITGKEINALSAKNVLAWAENLPKPEPSGVEEFSDSDFSQAERILAGLSDEDMNYIADLVFDYQNRYGEDWVIKLNADDISGQLFIDLPQSVSDLLNDAVASAIFDNNQNALNDVRKYFEQLKRAEREPVPESDQPISNRAGNPDSQPAQSEGAGAIERPTPNTLRSAAEALQAEEGQVANEADPNRQNADLGMNDSWRTEFDRAKAANDLPALDTLYNKVKVVLNGLAQSKDPITVRQFEDFKRELEAYAEELKSQKTSNSPTKTSPAETVSSVSQEEKIANFTPAETINKGYQDIKAKIGEKKAKKYFEQVNRLINPNQNEIIQYRTNGVVVKEGDNYILKALSDMDMKSWRLSLEVNVNDQFEETPKDSLAEQVKSEIDNQIGELAASDPRVADVATPVDIELAENKKRQERKQKEIDDLKKQVRGKVQTGELFGEAVPDARVTDEIYRAFRENPTGYVLPVSLKKAIGYRIGNNTADTRDMVIFQNRKDDIKPYIGKKKQGDLFAGDTSGVQAQDAAKAAIAQKEAELSALKEKEKALLDEKAQSIKQKLDTDTRQQDLFAQQQNQPAPVMELEQVAGLGDIPNGSPYFYIARTGTQNIQYTLWYSNGKRNSADSYVQNLGTSASEAVAKLPQVTARILANGGKFQPFGMDGVILPAEKIYVATEPQEVAATGVVAGRIMPTGKYAKKGYSGQQTAGWVAENDPAYAAWFMANVKGPENQPFVDFFKTAPAVIDYLASQQQKGSRTFEENGTDEEQLRDTLDAYKIKLTTNTDGSYTITGETFAVKDKAKSNGAKWDSSQSGWKFQTPDGLIGFVKAINGGSLGRPATVAAGGTVPTELNALRDRISGQPDESSIPNGGRDFVKSDTESLLRRGEKFGIPSDVTDEQVEDAARIVRAYQQGKPLFLLASEPGSGKTFVLGAAMREMLRNGAKKIVYVTMNTSLIEQIKNDLKDYGIDGVEFITYTALSEGKTDPYETDVLMFDEAHNVKNHASKRGKQAAAWMAKAKTTVMASATPFENPTEAAYMAPTGIFSQWSENPANTQQAFQNFAVAFGGKLIKAGKDAKGNDIFRVIWEKGKTAERRSEQTQNQIAARDWFLKSGTFTQRKTRIPVEMMDTRFTRMNAPQQWTKLYEDIEDAEDMASGDYDDSGNMTGLDMYTRMWLTNFKKRVLEASKVEYGIELAKQAIAAGRSVVLFVETKAERSIDLQAEVDAYIEWQHLNNIDENPGPPPFPEGRYKWYLEMMDKGYKVLTIESAETIIENGLGKNNVAIYTGSVTDSKAKANLAEWRAKKKKVLVATMAKGGTGLSLHDTKGDRPTTQININLPWRATGVKQVAGRTARYGMQTKAESTWVFAENIPFDKMLAGRVGSRMRDMGALVGGEDLQMARNLEDWDLEEDSDLGIKPELDVPIVNPVQVAPVQQPTYRDFLLNRLEEKFGQQFPGQPFDRSGIVKKWDEMASSRSIDRANGMLEELIGSYSNKENARDIYQALRNEFAKKSVPVEAPKFQLNQNGPGGLLGGIAGLLSRNSGVAVVTDPEQYNNALTESGALALTNGRKPLAFRWQGKVYLSPDATLNSAFHEFGGIWAEIARTKFPALYKRGVALVRESGYFKKLQQDSYYKTLSPAEQEIEALETAIGDLGAQFKTEGRKRSFTDWLKDFWNGLVQKLGLPDKLYWTSSLEDWGRLVTNQMMQSPMGNANANLAFSLGEDERANIEQAAKANGTWLKAPNGQPTNLNPAQWVTVRTKAFTDWFGDWRNDPANASKVVDENGEPLVVYHGTNKDFNQFSTQRQLVGTSLEFTNNGFYFTPNQQYSYIRNAGIREGGNVMPVFLKILNPIEVGEGTIEYIGNAPADQLKVLPSADGYYWAYYTPDSAADWGQIFVQNPTQIKSAIGNNGSFDSSNPDIRFQLPQQTNDPLETPVSPDAILGSNPTTFEELRKQAENYYQNPASYTNATPGASSRNAFTGVDPELWSKSPSKYTAADKAFIKEIADQTGFKLTEPESVEYTRPNTLYHLADGRVVLLDKAVTANIVSEVFDKLQQDNTYRGRLTRFISDYLKPWINTTTFAELIDDTKGTLNELIRKVQLESARRANQVKNRLQDLENTAAEKLAKFDEAKIEVESYDYDPQGRIVRVKKMLPLTTAMEMVALGETQILSYKNKKATHIYDSEPLPNELYERDALGKLVRKEDHGAQVYDPETDTIDTIFLPREEFNNLYSRFTTGEGAMTGEKEAYTALTEFFNEGMVADALEAEQGKLNPDVDFIREKVYYPIRTSGGDSNARMERQGVLKLYDENRRLQVRSGTPKGIVVGNPIQTMRSYGTTVGDIIEYGRVTENMEHLKDAIADNYKGEKRSVLTKFLSQRISDLKTHRDKVRQAREESPITGVLERGMKRFTTSIFALNIGLPAKQIGSAMAALNQGIIDNKYLLDGKALSVLAKLTYGAYRDATVTANVRADGSEQGLSGGIFSEDNTLERPYLEEMLGNGLSEEERIKQQARFASVINRMLDTNNHYVGDVAFDDLGLNEKTLTAAQKALRKYDQFASDRLMSATRRADRAPVLYYYEAAKLQAQAEGLSGDDYWNRVADLTERVVAETYNLDNLLERTPTQLSTNFIMKVIGMYSSQQQKIANLLIKSMIGYVRAEPGSAEAKAARDKMLHTLAWGVVTNAVYVSAVGAGTSVLMAFLSGDEPKDSDELLARVGYDSVRNVIGIAPGIGSMAAEYLLNATDDIRGNEDMVDITALSNLQTGLDAIIAAGNYMIEDDEKKAAGALDTFASKSTDFLSKSLGIPSTVTRIVSKQIGHLDDEE